MSKPPPGLRDQPWKIGWMFWPLLYLSIQGRCSSCAPRGAGGPGEAGQGRRRDERDAGAS